MFRKKNTELAAICIYKNRKNLSVRSKNSSTESTHNSFPGFPVERNVTKPRGSSNIGHTCSTPAPRTRPRHRLAPPHLPPLVYQKAKANHFTSREKNPSACFQLRYLCVQLVINWVYTKQHVCGLQMYIYTVLIVSWSHVIAIVISNHDGFVLDGCHVGGSWGCNCDSYSFCRRK